MNVGLCGSRPTLDYVGFAASKVRNRIYHFYTIIVRLTADRHVVVAVVEDISTLL
jgi:hypothetical protein